MDIQRLIKSLKGKGINIVAKANSVTAGLIWGVEGLEKVPKLGEVLFYVVNGTRYGVKPKRGNKHDIDWYYKQLNMGMKGAKSYHAGLTQFLNTWIKKGELEIVFKGKATASVTSAKKLSSQEKCDALIDGLANGSINKDSFFKTVTKEYNLTPDCVAATRWLIKEWGKEDIKNNNEWPIHFRKLYQENGVKFLNNYLNDLLFDSRSELSGGSSESILDGLYKKFIGNKSTASVNEDGIIDKVSLTAIRNYLEQNNIEFDLKQNGRIYTFSFDCGKIILDDNNQKAKAFFDGKVKEAETMRELNDFFSKCKVVASAHISEEAIDNIILEEMNFNADKKKEGDSIIAWTLKARNRAFAVIRLNKVTNLAKIDTPYGKTLVSTISIDEELRNNLTRLLSEKAVASPQLVSETGIANLLYDMKLKAVKDKNPLHGSIWSFKNAEIRYKDGDDLAYIFLKNDFGSHKLNAECRTMDDVRNYITKHLNQFNKYNKVTGASPRKYRPSIRERMDRDSYLDPMDFGVKERPIVNKFNQFKKEVQSLEIGGVKPFFVIAHLEENDNDETFNKVACASIKLRNGFIKIECEEIEKKKLQNILKTLNNYKFTVLDLDNEGKISFPSFGKTNSKRQLIYPDAFEFTLQGLKNDVKIINALLKPFSNVKVIASTDADKVKEYINKINGLVIDGKKAFEATSTDDGVCIKLLLKKWNADNDYDVVSASEDSLRIIFPVTEKWAKADNSTNLKAGDITLYTDEYMSSQFNNELLLERDSSKVDFDNLDSELKDVYEALKDDCIVLNNLKNVKVTADTVTVEVKETAEVNEENFEGFNEEHDRLLFTKVTPEKFLNLWKTSKNFNGSQIQKIIYGFKLASRTLGSKFENKGILIEYFYSKKYGKGYIRVEYEKDLFIIYVAQSEDNGDIKVITRKMRKMIPTKNFNILSTSVSSLAFERAALPAGFKPVWEEVTQSN